MSIPSGCTDPWVVLDIVARMPRDRIDDASQFEGHPKFMETRIVIVVSMERMDYRRACLLYVFWVVTLMSKYRPPG